MRNSPSLANSEVVFFDGVCNLCNAFVNFLMARSTRLLFASLQGKTAAETLPKEMIDGLSSIVFYDHGRIYTESSAALRILTRLGGLYKLLGVFLIVPRFFRDAVYRFVASHRYSWFGKRDICRLPTPEERAQFLD
jgi:predicted DCC family thiol-disulfide oxidoreductase YuxK